jgi:aspartate-semialdehyde dehydrogenase
MRDGFGRNAGGAIFRRREEFVDPFKVGILGATGLVGQRLLERLAVHPWFEIAALGASDRSLGRTYRDAVRWTLSEDPPAAAARLEMRRCAPDAFAGCDVVLSGLDAAVARDVESRFVAAGFPVISNASSFRMEPDVPLVVPEVNASHLSLLGAQRRRTGGGYLVTNPNCSVTGLVIALAPLHRAFGVRRVVVSTYQALSGAGLTGPRGLEIVDNVIPWIPDEEEKIEREAGKVLGRVEEDAVIAADVRVSAHCHRVATVDGHLEAVSLELDRHASVEEAVRALRDFRGEVRDLRLPSAPERPIIVRDEPDRPQPRLDRDAGGGMSVVVGRVRPCPSLTLRLELLSHNAVRGAAGATLFNAELLAGTGMLERMGRR